MDENDTDEGPRSFTRQLEQISNGDLVAAASSEMHELLKAIKNEALLRRRAVKGAFTLKLTFSVEPNGIVDINPSIQTKRADRKLARGMMHLTPGGNLTAENPRQAKLPLREVTLDDDTTAAIDVSVGRSSAKEV